MGTTLKTSKYWHLGTVGTGENNELVPLTKASVGTDQVVIFQPGVGALQITDYRCRYRIQTSI